MGLRRSDIRAAASAGDSAPLLPRSSRLLAGVGFERASRVGSTLGKRVGVPAGGMGSMGSEPRPRRRSAARVPEGLPEEQVPVTLAAGDDRESTLQVQFPGRAGSAGA